MRGHPRVRTDEEMGSCLATADEDELAVEIWAAMTRRLCRKQIMTIITTEEETYSDAINREPPRHRKPLKSDKLRTDNSMVLKKVTWPHELVIPPCTGQLAVYKHLSITLFVSGYLAVTEMVKPALKPIMARHLKELMVDAELYG